MYGGRPRIELASFLGKRRRRPRSALPVTVRPAPVEAGRDVRILVVDDAPILRALFVRIATSFGHSVVGEADSPEVAVELARALAPDAIVLDSRVDSDLERSLSDLRLAAPQGVVLLVAASDEPLAVRLVREGRAAGIVRRPFSRGQIRDVLNDCVARARAERD